MAAGGTAEGGDGDDHQSDSDTHIGSFDKVTDDGASVEEFHELPGDVREMTMKEKVVRALEQRLYGHRVIETKKSVTFSAPADTEAGR
jgi:hypothetical protein